MPDQEDLRLPLEVPWKLASTTQALQAGGPNDVSISVFFFEPSDENLTSNFLDEKLVFLKFAVSVSPSRLAVGNPSLALGFLGEDLPVLHLLLDLKVLPESGETGGIRPYFHAAAPLNRRVLQTGVIGDDFFEGEAAGQFFGKSGSHLYESLDSHSRTTSFGGSAGFSIGGFGIGASARTSSTDVSSQRSVDQVVDTTTREASQERRELISHTTKVENMLTLLSAKFLGTPYLRFSMFPRPLQLLSIDPSDPNLWFNQLLHRRSTGIEGIQEFTAVIVVPKDQEFCVEARLSRICLLDNPPPEPNFNEPLVPDLLQLARIVRVLYDRFPKGTPLDELDIDIVEQLDPAEDFKRPVVRLWAIRLMSQIVEAVVVSPSAISGQASAASVNYKHLLELWLETLRAEYEEELARSPLERGTILNDSRLLTTCFAPNDDGAFEVSSSSTTGFGSSPVPIDFPVGDTRINVTPSFSSVRSKALQTITKWNTLEQRLSTFLYNLQELPAGDPRLDHPKLVDVLINRWGRLAPNDERNISFKAAAKILRLKPEHVRLLEKAGAKTLREMAQILNAAPEIEKQNVEVNAFLAHLKGDEGIFARRRIVLTPPEPVEFALSSQQAVEIRQAIGQGLQTGVEAPARREKRRRVK
ncbi:hypothetical protein L0337_12860 [candidate division KSB1 bacterium]|nr:hypothetical protein [candidate division KSB1 bacterium]